MAVKFMEGGDDFVSRSVDWNKVKNDYVKKRMTTNQLSKKYGIPAGTIRNHATFGRWGDDRAKCAEKVNRIFAETVAEQETNRIARFVSTADLLMDRITEGISNGDLLKSNKSLRDVTGAIKDLKEILGLKSDLDRAEQEARIARLKAVLPSDVDTGGGVLIMPSVAVADTPEGEDNA